MTCKTDATPPRTWVAIDIAKGVNVAVIEHQDGRQQRFRFVHQRDDYDRLVELLRSCSSPCRIALEPTADYHRTIAFRLVSEGFDLVLVHLWPARGYGRWFTTPGIRTIQRTLKLFCAFSSRE